MKLKTAFLLIFIFSIAFAQAQDIIIKKNGDEIKCKVMEISVTEISYQLPQVIDSAAKLATTMTVAKADVFMIKYENGTKDVFNEVEKKEPDYVAPKAMEEAAQSEQIIMVGKKYYFYHNHKLGVSKLHALLRKEKNKDINNLVSRSILCSVFSPILLYVSIPVGIIGIINLGIANDNISGTNNNDQLIAGSVLTGAFILAQVGGYVVKGFQNKNLKKAVELYNQNHK